MNKQSVKIIKHFLLLVIIAAILGLVAGGVTVGFVKLLTLIHELLWTTLPNEFGGLTGYYTVAVTLVGGLLVGLCNHFFGDYPKSLEQSLEHFKKKKQFDYKHLPQTVMASYASLGFGASLGPEAALISLVGGLGSWIATLLKRFTSLGEVAFISASATVATLFGSPLGGTLLTQNELPKKRSKIALYIPAIVAGFVSFAIFRHFSNGGFFEFNFLPYDFTPSDLPSIVLVSLGGLVLGLTFLHLNKITNYASDHLKVNDITHGILGGLVLGLLALLSSFVLFSGHEGIQELITDLPTFSGLALIAIALLKLVATSWLLSTGWKGGRFFPLMFAGSAFGLGLAILLNLDPMLGLGVGMSATLAAVLKRPFAAVLLLMFFFPVNMYILAILGALVAGILSKKLSSIS